MTALPPQLGTDEEEGLLPVTTQLVSPFLAKAFGLDEASLAAGSDAAPHSSGDASASLGSGGLANRYAGLPSSAAGLSRTHAASGDAGAHAALQGVPPPAAGERAALEAAAAGARTESHGGGHAKRARAAAEDPGAHGGAGGAGGEDGAAAGGKRPRLVWTPQLHKRFVDAVSHLGIKCAVPKTIMQLMNVEGLTRENVASHLQKYRLYLKRLQNSSAGAASLAAAAAAFGGVEDEDPDGTEDGGLPLGGSE